MKTEPFCSGEVTKNIFSDSQNAPLFKIENLWQSSVATSLARLVSGLVSKQEIQVFS